MLGDALAALTAAGGTALVEAMATDKWQSTRSAAARLFAHGCPAREAMIAAQLDSNAELVAQAEDPAKARRNLAPMWRLQLEALLFQYPEAEEKLRALVAQLRETPPASQQTWVQTDVARDALLNPAEHRPPSERQGDVPGVPASLFP